MTANCHCPVLTGGWRATKLDTRPIWQRCAQQWVFAIDPLMAHAGNLLGQPLDETIIDVGPSDFLHAPRRCIFDPDLARSIHQYFGDRVPL